MTPNERFRVGTDVMGIVIKMQSMIQYIVTTTDQLDRPTETYLAAYAITILTYGKKVLEIVQQPDVVQPIMGRRCIFY